MAAIVIKIVDRDKPDQVAEAQGELEGAGFTITYKDEADMIGIDAVKHGGGQQTYGAGHVIIGKKE